MPFVSELVFVVPLKENAHEDALRLLREQLPFDLDATPLTRQRVYATTREIIVVFETAEASTFRLRAEDPSVWKVAGDWQKLMAGPPRNARTAYSWERSADDEGVSYEPTPGPGDSEGGDIYGP
jgi:hypothetical protein